MPGPDPAPWVPKSVSQIEDHHQLIVRHKNADEWCGYCGHSDKTVGYDYQNSRRCCLCATLNILPGETISSLSAARYNKHLITPELNFQNGSKFFLWDFDLRVLRKVSVTHTNTLAEPLQPQEQIEVTAEMWG